MVSAGTCVENAERKNPRNFLKNEENTTLASRKTPLKNDFKAYFRR
jgi:hypothetical protein